MQLNINDQTILASDVEPTETVLSYLRRSGLTGTKEGCASGDCGACTIMVGRTHGGETQYHTINSCIAPISQYASHHIVTVEGLAEKNGNLNPVQQAMVDCHGSQCGFCTPGFVMSLTALSEDNSNLPTDSAQRLEKVREAISGNLCRCTGYRPILDAGLQALNSPAPGIKPPSRVPDPSTTDLPGGFYQPASIAELNAAIQQAPEARRIAGGTDLMLEVTQLYREFSGLIDLTQVPELLVLEENEAHLTIGAAVPYTQIEDFFSARSPQLVKLLHRLGSKQIRNSGSIGGNLANGSPIADMPPILMSWDTTLQVGNAEGRQRDISIMDFYRGYRDVDLNPDEYIVSVTIPIAAVNRYHRFYKNSKRIEDDISSVMGAFSFELDNQLIKTARIAYGGMAATPIRLIEVEETLIGQTITPDLIDAACDTASKLLTPMTDVRASAEYRKAMALQMLARALRESHGETFLDITEVALGAGS